MLCTNQLNTKPWTQAHSINSLLKYSVLLSFPPKKKKKTLLNCLHLVIVCNKIRRQQNLSFESYCVISFTDMFTFTIPVDVCTIHINIIINSRCHLNRVHYAFSLLRCIMELIILLNVIAYTSLIIKHKKPGVVPIPLNTKIVTYNTINDCLCPDGLLQKLYN